VNEEENGDDGGQTLREENFFLNQQQWLQQL
jgi:hypothetical protein